MFIALEVLSLPLYLMCGLARRRRLLSQESAVKYFLLGAFSSAFFLYGLALLYGYANSVKLADIAAAAAGSDRSDTLLFAGLGLPQTDVKRMVAYSSIAHAGFLLVGAIAMTRDGLSSTLFYLLAYGFTTLAAFGVISLVRDSSGEATHLSAWAGLAKRSPL